MGMKKQVNIVLALMAFVSAGCQNTITTPENPPTKQTAKPAVTNSIITKTAALQETVEFTLKNAYDDAVWIVYTESTGDTEADEVWAESDDTALTLGSDPDIEPGKYWVAVTEEGKTESVRIGLTVRAYNPPAPELNQTVKPAASVTGVTKTAASQSLVKFTLTNGSAYSADTTWKVYGAETGSTAAAGLSVLYDDGTLILNHSTDIPAGNYYIAATEPGKTESGRLKLTVTSFFVPVTDITGVPTDGIVGTPLLLSGTVEPADATNKTIEWRVTSAGTTGVTTGPITGTSITPTGTGTITLLAAISDGTAAGTGYTKTVTVLITAAFVAVTGITGSPAGGIVGTPLPLSGTVVPVEATNKTIEWGIQSAGTTAAGAAITGAELTVTGPGNVVVRAAISNGLAVGTPFSQNFTIHVAAGIVASPTAAPGAGVIDNSQLITLTSATTGGTLIYYTTDGPTPTASIGTLYTEPFLLGSSLPATVKAIAVKTGMEPSAVFTAGYVPETSGAVVDLTGITTAASMETKIDAAALPMIGGATVIPVKGLDYGTSATVAKFYQAAAEVISGDISLDFSACTGTAITGVAGLTTLDQTTRDRFVSITLQDALTEIGNNAFWGFSRLADITIPSGVTRIGDGAFARCSALAGLTIPDSVISIDTDAFFQCDGLKSVTLGTAVAAIGNRAFGSCSSLVSVTFTGSDRPALDGDGPFAGATAAALSGVYGIVTAPGGAFGAYNLLVGTKGLPGADRWSL
jgi:hypothetical protein